MKTLEGEWRPCPSFACQAEQLRQELYDALARSDELEEQQWPSEWQVATAERNKRKAVERKLAATQRVLRAAAHDVAAEMHRGRGDIDAMHKKSEEMWSFYEKAASGDLGRERGYDIAEWPDPAPLGED